MNTNHKMKRRILKCAIMAGALTMGAAPSVHAQNHVAFIPGMNESGGDWTNVINYLEGVLGMDGIAAYLQTRATYGDQAEELRDWLNVYPGYYVNAEPAVAHSNGGVVARLYERNFGNKLSGLLTVGTPHNGVPLARPANIDFARNWASQFGSAVTQALTLYRPPFGDPDFHDLEFPLGYPGWLFESDWLDIVQPVVVDLVLDDLWWEFVGLLTQGTLPPENNDYWPESPTFNLVNTDDWNESSKLATRVSISTVVDYNFAPYVIWLGDGGLAQSLKYIKDSLCYFAYAAWNYYLGHPDPVLQANAWVWGQVVQYCPVEYMWHVATTDYQPYPPLETDGLIPRYSTEYPGGTKLYLSQPWVPHTQQAKAPNPPFTEEQLQWLNEYKTVLNTYFGIPLPLGVSISGPRVC